MVRTPNSPHRWFDQITLTPTKKNVAVRSHDTVTPDVQRKDGPTKSHSKFSNNALPYISPSTNRVSPSTNRVEDMFAAIRKRPKIPSVDSQSAAEKIEKLEAEKAKAKERRRITTLKRRKKKTTAVAYR